MDRLSSKVRERARAISHLSGGKELKDFSRKIAKAVLSPREDIDERLTIGTEGGEDVYEVVERYKKELEQIISTLAPTHRTTGSSGGPPRSRSVRKAWEEAPSPGSDLKTTSRTKGRSKGERTRNRNK